MSDWSEGYVNGIDYTYDYYRELNPLAAKLALLNAGIACDSGATGVSCELGFGFGASTNIHAAASASQWWGTDFNPAQAGFARELGQASGANVHLFDQSFAEFCNRSDLPDFDFIGLHGIWSWVSDENRRLIVDFVRRRLRVGGVMYISYNTQPGWSQIVPMRQLMTEHAEVMSAPGNAIASRIESAIGFVDALVDASPGYAAINPAAAGRIKKLKEQNRNYLAHEYFNRDWQPMLFSEFARWFEPAKVSFACSALYSDHFDTFNLLPAQIEILRRIPDARFQQSVRDFVINRQFRKDYWIKGPRHFEAPERMVALRAHRVVLVSEPASIVLKAGGSLVEQDLPEAVYRPLIELLADRRIRSLGEIEAGLQARGISFAPMLEAVMVLVGKGDVASAQEEDAMERALPTTTRLNQYLIENSTRASRVRNLASPVTGGGLHVQSFHLQMLLARLKGRARPEQWAEFLLENLVANGAGIAKREGGVMSEQESLAALTDEAHSFATNQLPGLRALKVVD
jgi:SAM-dependent methyltransferase